MRPHLMPATAPSKRLPWWWGLTLVLFLIGWLWLLWHVSVLLAIKYAKWWGWLA